MEVIERELFEYLIIDEAC